MEGNTHELRETNTSFVFLIGGVFKTASCGNITILGQSVIPYIRPSGRKEFISFLVEFRDGTRVLAKGNNIKKGEVYNYNLPTIFGVGYRGYGCWATKINGVSTKEYVVWRHMLQRCYDQTYQITHPTYIGCTVDPRWHNFQNFCEDIQKLEGYAEWKADSLVKGRAKWELDKDLKQNDIKLKTYSKETCCFITSFKNIQEAVIRRNNSYLTTGKTYTAIRLHDNYKEDFLNQSHFADKYNLTVQCVYRCIHNSKATHKGWKFKIKEEEEN